MVLLCDWMNDFVFRIPMMSNHFAHLPSFLFLFTNCHDHPANVSEVFWWKTRRIFIYFFHCICIVECIRQYTAIETDPFTFLWIMCRLVLLLLFLLRLNWNLVLCSRIGRWKLLLTIFRLWLLCIISCKKKTGSFGLFFFAPLLVSSWLKIKHIGFDTNNQINRISMCAKCQLNTNTFNRFPNILSFEYIAQTSNNASHVHSVVNNIPDLDTVYCIHMNDGHKRKMPL